MEKVNISSFNNIIIIILIEKKETDKEFWITEVSNSTLTGLYVHL